MRHILFLTAVLSATTSFSLAMPGEQAKQSSSPAHHTSKSNATPLPSVTLPTEPGLYAVIYTSMGNIVCRLFEKEAPKTVGNFRGLADGTKAWTDPSSGKIKHTPLYSGTNFHRVIPGFMIQGGDPAGDGSGSPGFKFDDEIDPNYTFDHPGVLAMANSGPNTNGCQFFITVAPAEHLNGHYSIFGQVVTGQEVADAISQVPRNSEDTPETPVKIVAISIRRVVAAASSPGAKP
jgi:peptidyl-prolyl cis-trans isomerase A (cyclophilin A)